MSLKWFLYFKNDNKTMIGITIFNDNAKQNNILGAKQT